MEEIDNKETKDKLPKEVKKIAIVVGFLTAGSLIFSYFESSFFNTYLDHILNLPYYYISNILVV